MSTKVANYTIQLGNTESTYYLALSREDDDATLLSEIIQKNYYPIGSEVIITERATITLQINDLSLIDADYQWAEPILYLGSCQVYLDNNTSDANGARQYVAPGTSDPANTFHLTSTIVRIHREARYTIVDNNDLAIVAGEVFLDNCNFVTVSASIGVPPVVVEAQVIEASENIWNGKLYTTPPGLEDQPYLPILSVIGIHLKPGVFIVTAKLRLSTDDRQIFANGVLQPAYTCNISGSTACQTEMANIQARSLLVRGFYLTLADAQAAIALGISAGTTPSNIVQSAYASVYTCSTDTTVTWSGYRIRNDPKP